MRHRKDSKRLGRFTSLKKATLRDLSKAVLIHERIVTTEAKARLARKTVEGLISLGKDGSLAARRRAFAVLCDHTLVKRLFEQVAPRYKNRAGGFTKIFFLLDRRGDGARQVVLELTDRIIKEKKKIVKPKSETSPLSKETAAPKHTIEEKPVVETTPPKPEVKETPKVKKEKPPEKPAEKPKQEKEPKKKLFGGFGKLFRKPKNQK